MRVIYFGTPDFAVPSLKALLGAHDVVAVVTQPDRPRGRGQKVTFSPVKAVAVEHGVPVMQPTHLKDPEWQTELAALGADIGVVAAYGRLLPQSLLDLPRLGVINVHASLLPRWRGAAPIHRAVLAGDATTGVTIMRVVLALDAGPVLAAAATPIEPADTSHTLESRLSSVGAALLLSTMSAIEDGTCREEPQDETLVTYASRLERHESQVDWYRSARQVDQQIRGLQPWPLAGALVDGTRVSFLRAEVEDSADAVATPGTVLTADRQGIRVACAEGVIRITEVRPEGKRAMEAGAFVNGSPIPAGTVMAPL